MTILSDIPDDPSVSDGWPWCIGATGILSVVLGTVICFVERIQRSNDRLDGRDVRAEERRRRTLEQLSQ
ncbi:MAG: hypothetical protein WEC83_00370 [Patescibacteria group bacterium]